MVKLRRYEPTSLISVCLPFAHVVARFVEPLRTLCGILGPVEFPFSVEAHVVRRMVIFHFRNGLEVVGGVRHHEGVAWNLAYAESLDGLPFGFVGIGAGRREPFCRLGP